MLKKSLIGLLGLLALIVGGRLLYLLPAQIEVRQIRPDLPERAAFEALLNSRDGPVSVAAFQTSRQTGPGLSIGHHTVVIEWADGRLLLIDAGMDEAAALDFGRLFEALVDAEPAVVETTAVEKLGSRLPDVAAIAFTHLHIDHTQGAAALCAANPETVVLQTLHQRDKHNSNTREGAGIVSACRPAEAIAADELVELTDFPGVAMYSLGGHTPGSTLYAVAYEGRVLLFSGDITNSKADLMENKGKGFAYSYLLVPEDTARTAQLRAWLRTLDAADNLAVYVSHDIEDMRELAPFNSG